MEKGVQGFLGLRLFFGGAGFFSRARTFFGIADFMSGLFSGGVSFFQELVLFSGLRIFAVRAFSRRCGLVGKGVRGF